MFRYTHCIKDVLLAKFQAIFRGKERLEALLFYFLDTIPNRWVFAVQEAMFKESLFRGLYGGDGGFHRGFGGLFLCQKAAALKRYQDSAAFSGMLSFSYPSMSGSNDTKLRWCWWCTSGGVICLVRLELSDPKGNCSFARHFTELFSLSDLLICPRILFRGINLMARIVIAAVKIAPRNSPPVEFGELFLRDLDL